MKQNNRLNINEITTIQIVLKDQISNTETFK